MDATDRRMLEVLQLEGRISNAALAERLHLSPSPCLRRLRALEDEGVIAGYRAVLDRQKVGLPMTVFVELKLDGHSDRSAAAISEALAATPEIISAHIVSGAADFLLEVAVADLAGVRAPDVRDAAEAAQRRRRALELPAADGEAPGPLPVYEATASHSS